ncbi:thioredoxin family protein [Sporosarcina thermotolerans]|uniref:Thioredoxin family protein n=1 Tax=Sporosarcina thermotolerans TaxID=633404 RepID=A0AAW9A936_9BACL|nr:thioredoxin family protein [Sporosarcina thermotolerans]MDW0117564.1 thioredoxin family protein [Sporosarcina thermotolerans]WHT49898.1 thioredoxin family protein [Sporosarcina thermotolerans]
MENWTIEQWEKSKKESSKSVFYLYTPMCGTCMVASIMVEVISAMKPDLPIGKADLNFIEDLAIDYEIESVPCLLIQENGKVTHKIYAFQSVPYLLEQIG